MYDLTIIGGGPAGTSAAIGAARSGGSVRIVERGRFPRHKVCGEFVSAESLELLGGLLESQPKLIREAVRIPATRIFLDGRVLCTPITPPAASIARFDLDEALWKAAIDSGVDARDQTVVQKITGQGPFAIATTAGEFKTKALINASGRWSNFTSAPGSKNANSEKWLGVKAHYLETRPPNSVDLYFFDGGYCGVQPLDLGFTNSTPGRINACAMVRAGIASTLPEVFTRHPLLQERSRRWQLASETVTTSPLIFREPQPVEGNILRCGDAAGFVDPFVGDGISLALRSGALAAEALMASLNGTASLEAAVAHYRRSYEARLAPIFRNSSLLRQALRLPKALRAPALFVLENVPALTRQLVSLTR
jgi:menaquinone-9 beta-reductase